MSQYKVPQDVEADDKLLGPFSARQLVYLFIAAGLITLATGLYNLYPLLCVIPIPFILFLLILALPLKKDQPMEAYLVAIFSFYFKPNKRFWNPGQRESTILITAPKKQDIGPKIRNITGDEASRRLAFLSNIIDSEGKAINSSWNNNINEEYIAQLASTPDVFEDYHSTQIEDSINKSSQEQHQKVIKQMQDAITKTEQINNTPFYQQQNENPTPTINSTLTVNINDENAENIDNIYNNIQNNYQPSQQDIVNQSQKMSYNQPVEEYLSTNTNITINNSSPDYQNNSQPQAIIKNPEIDQKYKSLTENQVYSVSTIAKEANRIKNTSNNNNEIYISLR